jgi:hypothetical protein
MSLLLLEYQEKTLIIQTKVYVIITFRVSGEKHLSYRLKCMSLLLLEYQKETLIIQTKVYVIITFRVSGENTYHTDQSVCHYYF